MSSNYQPRRSGGRGAYQQANGAPRNQMSVPFSTFPPHLNSLLPYQEPHFVPSPGTVTTVWNPSNFPSGQPRSPSAIMHPNRNPPAPFYNQTQKSVTFTADGRFVSSHSTLPLDRNDHEFPPLPQRATGNDPYQPSSAKHQPSSANYQPSSTSLLPLGGPSSFSFTVANTANSGLLPIPGNSSLSLNPGHSHINLASISHPNGGTPMMSPNGAHVVGGPQIYQVPPATPFTVLPYDAKNSWQKNSMPRYPRPIAFLPETRMGYGPDRINWQRPGDPQRNTAPMATDIRLLPADFQVPLQHHYEHDRQRNRYWAPRQNGPFTGPPFPQMSLSSSSQFENETFISGADRAGFSEANVANFSAEDFICRRMFREAAFHIMKLGRQNDFPLEIIALPLLCCGNSALLEKYVAKQPELQMKLIKLVEQLHSDSNFNRSIIQEYSRDYCRAQSCLLNFQKLKKIATSWVHAFNIDPFEVGSIYLDRCHGAIMYHIKNCTFEEISLEAWLENVNDLVKPYPEDLKAFTLNQLISRRKDNEIMGRIMQLWNVNTWNGRSVLDLLKIPAIFPNPRKFGKTFHPCGLPREAILVVDTLEAFHGALEDFEAESQCVLGVDCEWNSSRTGLEVVQLALLQISTRSFCYLLDIFSLKQLLTAEDWRHLTAVFQNPRIKKLGFDFSQDVQMLKPFLPGYHGGYHENNIVDLKSMTEHLAADYPDIFGGEKSVTDAPEPELRFALASIVERVLGSPLSKLERMSNWEGRPMREAQIVYAASDAHCLIEVYDKLAENCHVRGIQFPPKSVRLRTGPKKNDQRKNSLKKSPDPLPASPVGSSIDGPQPSLENLNDELASSQNQSSNDFVQATAVEAFLESSTPSSPDNKTRQSLFKSDEL